MSTAYTSQELLRRSISEAIDDRALVPARPWGRWLFGAVVTLTFVLARASLGRHAPGDETAQVIFLVPVTLAIYLGGTAGGLIATSVMGLAVRWWMLDPSDSLHIADPMQAWEWYLTVAIGALFSVVGGVLQRERDAAARSGAFLAATFASVDQALATIDAQGRVTFINDAAEQMTGWPKRRAIGRPVREVFAVFADSTGEALDLGDAPSGFLSPELRLIGADGREQPVQCRLSAIKSSHIGLVGARVLHMRDLRAEHEARIAAEQRLQAEQEMADLARTSPGMLFTFTQLENEPDSPGELRFANGEFNQWLGVEPGGPARARQRLIERMHPDDRRRVHDSVVRAGQQMGPWRDHFRLRHPDGRTRTMQGHAIPHRRDAGGRLWRGVLLDITEMADAVDALRVAREQLRDVIEHAPVSIVLLDRQLRHVAESARWRTLFHREGERLAGRSHMEVRRDLPDVWHRYFFEALSGTGVSGTDDSGPVLDGERTRMSFGIHPWRTKDGEVGGVIIYAEPALR